MGHQQIPIPSSLSTKYADKGTSPSPTHMEWKEFHQKPPLYATHSTHMREHWIPFKGKDPQQTKNHWAEQPGPTYYQGTSIHYSNGDI